VNYRDANQPVPVLPSTSQGTASTNSAELRYYVYVLRRRWWLISLVAIAVMAGAYWRASRQVPHYTAEARVLREIKHNLIQDGWSGLYEMQPEALAVQLDLIRAHDVLKPVVDSLGLRLVFDDPRIRRSERLTQVHVDPFAPTGKYMLRRAGREVAITDADGETIIGRGPISEPVSGNGFRIKLAPEYALTEPLAFSIVDETVAEDAIRESLRPEQMNSSMMMRIRYTDSDPVLAAAVTNAVAQSYRWESGEYARREARQRSALLRNNLAMIQDSLAVAQGQVRDYNREAGLSGLGAESNAITNEVANAHAEARRYREQADLLRELIRALDAGSREAIDRAAAMAADNGGLQVAYTRITDLQAERGRAISEGATPDSRRIVALDQQIANATNTLRRVVEANLRVANERLAAAERHEAEVRNRYGVLTSRLVGVDAARQRVDALTQHYNMVAQNYLNAQISEQMDQANVRITQPATIPTEPTGGRIPRTLFFAFVIGTALGIVAALVLEQIDTRVRDPEDAQRAASVGVIGLIPELRGDGSRPLTAIDDQSVGAEAYRKLRTNLRFARTERPRAIAVTSPSPQEGKSVTAANLALAIAQQGQSVLIVDADLRRPVQHEIFDADRTPGLSDALVGLVQPLAAAHPYHGMPNLHVMPCGTEPPNPAELLGSESFVRFLKQMLDKFDTVIIDTPPVNLVTDAAVIGSVCDGVLLVAEAGQTDRSVLANAVAELRHARGTVLGIVLNRAGGSARYGKYGRYGYDKSEYYTKTPSAKNSFRDWIAALI
jgi:capsular exopolysaccharide synthesis family protein